MSQKAMSENPEFLTAFVRNPAICGSSLLCAIRPELLNSTLCVLSLPSRPAGGGDGENAHRLQPEAETLAAVAGIGS